MRYRPFGAIPFLLFTPSLPLPRNNKAARQTNRTFSPDRISWSARRRFLFYPAPGFRHPYYETLYLVGHSGYSWRRLPQAAIATTWASIAVVSTRMAATTVRTVFRRVASRNRESTHWVFYWPADRESLALESGHSVEKTRLRGVATTGLVRCGTSATTGIAGRLFRRVVLAPTICFSVASVSAQITATTVRTVFSCVASRNRERGRSAVLLACRFRACRVKCIFKKTSSSGARPRHPPVAFAPLRGRRLEESRLPAGWLSV